ncbi:putative spindle-pole body protein (Pcp1) [Aspergillus ibericus CBS 121593]|uniref:Spindle-pole body protein n=1 Tax=Aspergillus ibericus CBS 121593 TaxID=1448316 RepID=A0A395GWH1_9EURO|nr:spindle-pole body protein [Aspergillus ibericus CBS 121593]RAK99875.1 spindle-pole body protein [Aspergillus ibericus CBS 121593]
MAYPYIDTPRTEIDGNATYLTGYRSVGRPNLTALDSVENSFATPSKDDDVLKGFGEGRRRTSGSFKINTPRAGSGPKSTRSALNSRHQLPTAALAKGEFTPLMRSATKNNFLKNMSTTRGPKTPGHIGRSYLSNGNTPGLPAMEMTDIDEEDATDDQPTPVPQVASSSVQSTPLPGLSRSGGVLNEGNNMTLKEQEKMIDQLDKDNFGLKLKIHFLQEQLEKAGPAYNQAALKENTELKVSKLTMQRDISRYKKSLQQAERDLESYRIQFQELREKTRGRPTDDTIQREMDLMRDEMDARDNQIRELQEELRDAKDSQSQKIEKLRDEIEDLEASVRERDRSLEERDEEIEELKDRDGKERDALTELESELQRAKEQMEELQESLDQAKSDAREARDAAGHAIMEKDQAQKDLQELHDEMANKSISTSGLTRQLEEKATKLEEELRELQQENSALKKDLEARSRDESRLEERHQESQHKMEERERKLLDDVAQARRERDLARQEYEKTSAQLQEALDEVQRKADEKELLQTRHHALTDESGGLQHELARAQSKIKELQQTIEEEKHHALDSANTVRSHYKEELERLQEEIESLHHEIEDKEGQFALEQDRWESTRRALQLQKDRAEDQAAGFKRTIEKLEQVEHTLSGKEMKLQEVIDSEKTRHFNSEAVLSRQVKELNDDLTSKREIIDEQRNEVLSLKEDLRLVRRSEAAQREKIQALEDELVVLQSSLEEEQEYTKGRTQKGSAEHDGQIQKLITEKQRLRDQLANAHVELHDLRTSAAEIEAERDELQAQLDQMQNQVDDTTRFDKEKVELRKSALRLEGEVRRLKDDKSSLLEAKETLEKQLSTEIERATLEENRLSAEIDQLQDKLHTSSGGRDRELALSKSKIQRLERRIQELETLLHQQPHTEIEHSTADLSVLRHSLDEARKREKALLQREADQKSSVRTSKARIAELERELHDAMMTKYESRSPSSSPSNKLHDELRSLRKQLSDAHRTLQEVKSKNRDLERAAMREEDQRDLHELLKSSTLEAESLALKVSERDARMSELKAQMRRIRDERSFCARKAESALKELEALQERYDHLVEKMGARTENNKTRHEKEILGLGKEIIWLRARMKREEKFRRDLAWSKGLMELGERVRVACNEADLRMITDMGVKPRDRNKLRTPQAKLKTAVSMVKAIVRMQRMSQEWKKTKKLGEGLRRAKNEVMKRRDASHSKN